MTDIKFTFDELVRWILPEISVLKAKQDAIEGSFFSFLKEHYPEEFEIRHVSFQAHEKSRRHYHLSEIPQVEKAILDSLKKQLGLNDSDLEP